MFTMDITREDSPKGRKSSILKASKPRLPLQDVNWGSTYDDDTTEVRRRRVSFSSVNQIKKFHANAESLVVSGTPAYEEEFSMSAESPNIQNLLPSSTYKDENTPLKSVVVLSSPVSGSSTEDMEVDVSLNIQNHLVVPVICGETTGNLQILGHVPTTPGVWNLEQSMNQSLEFSCMVSNHMSIPSMEMTGTASRLISSGIPLPEDMSTTMPANCLPTSVTSNSVEITSAVTPNRPIELAHGIPQLLGLKPLDSDAHLMCSSSVPLGDSTPSTATTDFTRAVAGDLIKNVKTPLSSKLSMNGTPAPSYAMDMTCTTMQYRPSIVTATPAKEMLAEMFSSPSTNATPVAQQSMEFTRGVPLNMPLFSVPCADESIEITAPVIGRPSNIFNLLGQVEPVDQLVNEQTSIGMDKSILDDNNTSNNQDMDLSNICSVNDSDMENTVGASAMELSNAACNSPNIIHCSAADAVNLEQHTAVISPKSTCHQDHMNFESPAYKKTKISLCPKETVDLDGSTEETESVSRKKIQQNNEDGQTVMSSFSSARKMRKSLAPMPVETVSTEEAEISNSGQLSMEETTTESNDLHKSAAGADNCMPRFSIASSNIELEETEQKEESNIPLQEFSAKKQMRKSLGTLSNVNYIPETHQELPQCPSITSMEETFTETNDMFKNSFGSDRLPQPRKSNIFTAGEVKIPSDEDNISELTKNKRVSIRKSLISDNSKDEYCQKTHNLSQNSRMEETITESNDIFRYTVGSDFVAPVIPPDISQDVETTLVVEHSQLSIAAASFFTVPPICVQKSEDLTDSDETAQIKNFTLPDVDLTGMLGGPHSSTNSPSDDIFRETCNLFEYNRKSIQLCDQPSGMPSTTDRMDFESKASKKTSISPLVSPHKLSAPAKRVSCVDVVPNQNAETSLPFPVFTVSMIEQTKPIQSNEQTLPNPLNVSNQIIDIPSNSCPPSNLFPNSPPVFTASENEFAEHEGCHEMVHTNELVMNVSAKVNCLNVSTETLNVVVEQECLPESIDSDVALRNPALLNVSTKMDILNDSTKDESLCVSTEQKCLNEIGNTDILNEPTNPDFLNVSRKIDGLNNSVNDQDLDVHTEQECLNEISNCDVLNEPGSPVILSNSTKMDSLKAEGCLHIHTEQKYQNESINHDDDESTVPDKLDDLNMTTNPSALNVSADESPVVLKETLPCDEVNNQLHRLSIGPPCQISSSSQERIILENLQPTKAEISPAANCGFPVEEECTMDVSSDQGHQFCERIDIEKMDLSACSGDKGPSVEEYIKISACPSNASIECRDNQTQNSDSPRKDSLPPSNEAMEVTEEDKVTELPAPVLPRPLSSRVSFASAYGRRESNLGRPIFESTRLSSAPSSKSSSLLSATSRPSCSVLKRTGTAQELFAELMESLGFVWKGHLNAWLKSWLSNSLLLILKIDTPENVNTIRTQSALRRLPVSLAKLVVHKRLEDEILRFMLNDLVNEKNELLNQNLKAFQNIPEVTDDISKHVDTIKLIRNAIHQLDILEVESSFLDGSYIFQVFTLSVCVEYEVHISLLNWRQGLQNLELSIIKLDGFGDMELESVKAIYNQITNSKRKLLIFFSELLRFNLNRAE